jgi:hypothetical protein
MFALLRGYFMPFFSAIVAVVFSVTHARARGRAGLRWICLIALFGLVIEFALGMILNIYIMIPAADARASYLREIETAPGFLTAHALIGLLLLAAASIMLLRSIALRDMVVITPSAAGLTALLGAFAAGEVFVKNSDSGASMSMAILTGVALVCYIGLQAILGGSGPRRGPVPLASWQARHRPEDLWTGLDAGD